jgi:hypothetical protein
MAFYDIWHASGAFRDRKVRQLRSRPDLGAHGGPTAL